MSRRPILAANRGVWSPHFAFIKIIRAPCTNKTVPWAFQRREGEMAVYKVIELVGTSTDSWEKAAAAAVEAASKSLRDLRIAEISELDVQLEDGKVRAYRAKVKVSFKYEGGD